MYTLRFFVLILTALFCATLSSAATQNAKPNIIFILTDDQDLHLNSLDYMPKLQKQLIQQGTTFNKHYSHVSQCCPSRATLWTGRHAHNTNITDVRNDVPGGAWAHVQKFGWYDKYLPVWMQQGGYKTYYSGKIYNGFTTESYYKAPGGEKKTLAGLTKGDLLIDPGAYSYYDSKFIHTEGGNWNTWKPRNVKGYSTDVITDNILGYIDEAVKDPDGKPFFAVAAPIAPHTSLGVTYPNNHTTLPYPVPKKEYQHLFQDVQIPRNLNFNPDRRSGVAAVWSLEQLSESNVGLLDEFHRKRLQCLQSVDDMIDNIINKLEDLNIMDNTYIIYSSDQGYHIGQHRLQPGKLQCFEEDVNIPFIIRGPTVKKAYSTDLVTGHIDLAPTILELAGIDINPAWKLDGQAISFPLENEDDFNRNFASRGEHTHLEFWGPFTQESLYHNVSVDVNKNLQIYKALRIQGEGYNIMYSVWCQDGAYELYDMSVDPYQMTNLHPFAPVEYPGQLNAYWSGNNTLLGRPTEHVIARLDALVLVQKTCVGDECRNPWAQLHPHDNCTSLAHALDSKYDRYYANSFEVAHVGWKQCFTGYNRTHSSTLYSLENEEPLWTNATVRRLVQSSGRRMAETPAPRVIVGWLGWVGVRALLGF